MPVKTRRVDLDATGAGVEARREELLEAAARLFADRGFERTTMEDVVAVAGVAKGTVYWYYRSKKALFLAVLERAAEAYRTELGRAAGRARSPLERLERAISGTMAFARQRPDLCRLYFQQVLVDDADFVRRRTAIYGGLLEELKATILEAVRSGQARTRDVDLVARMIVGAVEAGVRYALEGNGGRGERSSDEMRAFVAGAIATGRR